MRIDALDHGYVRFVEAWGKGDANEKEAGIIEAARQSTAGAFRGWELDSKLLRFLYDHHHDSPFEFAGLVIEVQAPIFVFREWHRHRTQSYNEMSGRYVELPDLTYIPSIERLMASKQATTNAQGSAEGISEADARHYRNRIIEASAVSRGYYEAMLGAGVAREVARVVLPVGQYSRMRASANLRNWLAFLTLRMAPNAQYEIRQYANAVNEIVKQEFPQTWSLFNEAKRV